MIKYSATVCTVCSEITHDSTVYHDDASLYSVCPDCLAALLTRAEKPARWNAFVLKHDDGTKWFESLFMPIRPPNKLDCK